MALFSGCACPVGVQRQFAFSHDTFAYANELRWRYSFDDSSATTTTIERPPATPSYSLHCFPMLRAAREFFYHARFDPAQPRTNAGAYKVLVRQIVHRNSRCPSMEEKRIVLPGFADLHEFSAAYPDLLKRACGGAWLSFFQRGNWRMVFPLPRRSEEKTAAHFSRELRCGRLPVAHIYTFPNTRLNHALLIYDQTETEDALVFRSYDPNNPDQPAMLRFERRTRAFLFERNQYFAGGPVQVYEVYRGLLY